MSYVVDQNGKMTIHLEYPEDVDDEDEDVGDHRDKAVTKCFCDVEVIYRDPFA